MHALGSLSGASLLVLATLGGLASAELTKYTGAAPALPAGRKAFGFGSKATGGVGAKPENIYVVDNVLDLRQALNLTVPRIVYVKGTISGAYTLDNATNSETVTSCKWYAEKAGVPKLDFTEYMKSLNASYMNTVEAAANKSGTIEGKNAKTYLALLNQQQAWRKAASDVERTVVNINAKGNVSIIGLDNKAYIKGIQLTFTKQDNVVIRNVRFSSPRDCYPEPESVTAWNARYDAVTVSGSSNFWVDGNIFADGAQPEVRDELGLWGWNIDRYDGLFDSNKGSDFITFSHNIVGNHHKSMLLGGSRNDRAVDVGKMQFTLFANHFITSESRNPMFRHGLLYLVNNLFTQINNNNEGRYNPASPATLGPAEPVPVFATKYNPLFLYNTALDSVGSALFAGNVYRQSGSLKNDNTRLIRFSNQDATNKVTVCVPSSMQSTLAAGLKSLASVPSSLQGDDLDLQTIIKQSYTYAVATNASKADALITSCAGFPAQVLPVTFKSSSDVENYVNAQAGQVGKNKP